MSVAQKIVLAATVSTCTFAQTDWPVYGHDPGGMRYSPLKQINTRNVGKLRRAWTYHTGETGRQFESTPIVVGNRMYVSTQLSRIIALEPETGKEIWSYDPKVQRPREHRGVAYWPGDDHTRPRILFGTGDGRLIALDSETGRKIPDFADNGEVDLRSGIADKYPKAGYGITSPPAIYRNLVIVGPSTPEGPSLGPSGDPRAFDVRTGKTCLEVPYRSAAGRTGQRNLGIRWMARTVRAEPVGIDQCRYGERACAPCNRQPRGQLVGRRSEGD